MAETGVLLEHYLKLTLTSSLRGWWKQNHLFFFFWSNIFFLEISKLWLSKIVYLRNEFIPLSIKTQVKDEFSEPKDGKKKDFFLNSGISHIIFSFLYMVQWHVGILFSEACTLRVKEVYKGSWLRPVHISLSWAMTLRGMGFLSPPNWTEETASHLWGGICRIHTQIHF